MRNRNLAHGDPKSYVSFGSDVNGAQIVIARRPSKAKSGQRGPRRRPFINVDSWYERAVDRLRRKGVDWHVLNVAPSHQRQRDAFRSVALACEMRFREQKSVAAQGHGITGARKPIKSLTDVALDSLKELGPFCGPLKPLLGEIQEELHRSIYPPSDVQRVEDEKVPCFERAERQEDAIEMLTEENVILRKRLSDQSAALMKLEEKANSYLSRTKKLKEKIVEKEEELSLAKLSSIRSNHAYDRLKGEHEDVVTRAEASEKMLKEMKEMLKEFKRRKQEDTENLVNEIEILQQQNLDLQSMITQRKS